MTAHTAGGKRAELARARRAQIVDAALEAFAETGFHGASLRDIATRAGLTHAGVLYHYPDKETLLAAVLLRRDEQISTRHRVDAQDGLAALRGFAALASENVSARQMVELFVTLSGEAASPTHPAHAYFADRYRTVMDHLEPAVADLRARGLLAAPELTDAQVARQLVAVSDGMQLQWLITDGALDLVVEMHAAVQRFVTVPL